MVPSITELLYHLGLGERVVGITRFCTHPQYWHLVKQRIGGTKDVKTDIVLGLKPDLEIANHEENVEAQVLKLASATNVWLTDISTLDDALDMIRDLGSICGQAAVAQQMVSKINSGFHSLPKLYKPQRVVYLIWEKPVMAVGGGTFIHHLLERVGLVNMPGHRQRYPVIEPEELVSAPPDLLLLSSEPFPFGEKHRMAWQEKLPGTRVELVDGSYFGWYGSRLLSATGYFSACIGRWNQAL